MQEEKIDRSPDVLSKKVNLVSSDGVVFEVDLGLALMSKRFEDIIDIETIPIGDVDTISVDEVNSKMLSMVVEYCKKYVDLKDWDAQFVDVDPKTLDDLETHARYLKIERLGNLAFYKEFDLIKDKTPEETRPVLCRSRRLKLQVIRREPRVESLDFTTCKLLFTFTL